MLRTNYANDYYIKFCKNDSLKNEDFLTALAKLGHPLFHFKIFSKLQIHFWFFIWKRPKFIFSHFVEIVFAGNARKSGIYFSRGNPTLTYTTKVSKCCYFAYSDYNMTHGQSKTCLICSTLEYFEGSLDYFRSFFTSLFLSDHFEITIKLFLLNNFKQKFRFKL